MRVDHKNQSQGKTGPAMGIVGTYKTLGDGWETATHSSER